MYTHLEAVGRVHTHAQNRQNVKDVGDVRRKREVLNARGVVIVLRPRV